MLSDFFRINFPYGLMRNENGEWTAFNRDYLPLGHNSKPDTFLPDEEYLKLFQFTKIQKSISMTLESLWEEEVMILIQELNSLHMI